MIDVVCLRRECGKQYKIYPSEAKLGRRKYCSQSCASLDYHARSRIHLVKVCSQCKGQFKVTSAFEHRKYCSVLCFRMSWKDRAKYLAGGYFVLSGRYDHPLARGGVIEEHRMVLYDEIGIGPHPCHWCGDELNWGGRDGINVDHLNHDKLDNRIENLVASCRICNGVRM